MTTVWSPLRPVLLVALLLLSGCGADSRHLDLCRRSLAVLAEGSRETAGGQGWLGGGIRLDYLDRFGQAHRLVCRFDADDPRRHRATVADMAIDGRSLPPVRLVLLVHWLGAGLSPALLTADLIGAPAGFSWPYLVQALLNGLCAGAVLALVAVGYSLVYGISGTIQFAFGEVVMIGAYLMLTLTLALAAPLGAGVATLAGAPPGGPLWLLLAVVSGCLAASAALGLTMERLVYRPVRQSGSLLSMVGAIGLSVLLQNAMLLLQGSSDKWLPPVLPGTIELRTGGFVLSLSAARLLALGLALICAVAVARLIGRSPFGRAWRACAEDHRAAALMGVDVDRTVARSFALGAILAGMAGLLTTLQFGEADFAMGLAIGFKALTAALIGGIGSLAGAVAGGLLIGLTDALWSAYFSHAFKDVAIFGLLVTVLLLRPAARPGP